MAKQTAMERAIARAAEIRQNSEGPDARWQRVEPPAPAQQQSAPPPTLLSGFRLPSRPLPPVSVAPDNLRQFEQQTPVPQRRVIGPNPL